MRSRVSSDPRGLGPFCLATPWRACLLSLVLAACGAKTGLLVPEPYVDSGIDREDIVDAFDATDIVDVPADEAGPPPDVCVVGPIPLERRSAEVLFVIDRSGSMRFDLMGQDVGALARWDVLHDALARALPPFQSDIDMGAYFFPEDLGGALLRPCTIHRAIDVAPARNNVAPILEAFELIRPFGATPTFDALRFAGDYVTAHVSRSHQPALVLATDGGPNCNSALDPLSCVCTNTNDAGIPTCNRMAIVCLDDTRTVDEVSRLAAAGVPTYVVGIDDPLHPEYTDTLNRMAVAGGHPATGVTQFYSIRSMEALVTAFTLIQQSIARCAYLLPSRPADPSRVAVEIGGVVAPRDVTHTSGWDWTGDNMDEIALYGDACDRAARAAPRGFVLCPAR